MRDTYTRDVRPEMMKELNTGAFAPITKFVRNNKELALCFRGNATDTEYGKVIVYKNNHLIWELYLSNSGPVIKISQNHARFMEEWKSVIKQLMDDWEFKGPKDYPTYKSLDDAHRFIVKHKTKYGYSFDMVDLTYRLPKNHRVTDNFVKKTYELLNEMQESYFDKRYTKDNLPIDYFEKYYKHDKEVCYASPQPCIEKHVQQDLFLHNHSWGNGVYIYDLEYDQPSINGKKIGKGNKPDMLGIRFDKEEGLSICFIEVKSTESALTGDSSVMKHLEGMEKYISEPFEGRNLMEDRKQEAFKILNQYHDLRLYGVDKILDKDEFIRNLHTEIIFVFTDPISSMDNFMRRRFHKKLLDKGYERYYGIKDDKNLYATGIVAYKKRYS